MPGQVNLYFMFRKTCMNSRIFLLPFLFAAASASAQSGAAAGKQCYEQPSHAAARACLEKQARQSALSVTRAEALVRSSLEKWDQEPAIRSRSLSAFETSVSQFIHYRETQCEFHASLAAGGNAAGDRRLLCEIELNNRRAAELQAIPGDLQ